MYTSLSEVILSFIFFFQTEAPSSVVRVEISARDKLRCRWIAYTWAEFENYYFDADMAADIWEAA